MLECTYNTKGYCMNASQTQAIRNTSNWYSGRVPKQQDRLISFVIDSLKLARMVDGRTNITLTSTSNTAYRDRDNAVLPAAYFSEDFHRQFGIDDNFELAALACANGSLIHEALHIKHSPLTITAMIYPLGLTKEYDMQILGLCMNIVEDLFIENWLLNKNPSLHVLIQNKNDIFFTEENLESQKLRLSGTDDLRPVFSSIAAFYKNVRLRGMFGYEELSSIMDKALNVKLSQKERSLIAYELYLKICTEAHDKQEDNKQQDEDNGDSQDNSDSQDNESQDSDNSESQGSDDGSDDYVNPEDYDGTGDDEYSSSGRYSGIPSPESAAQCLDTDDFRSGEFETFEISPDESHKIHKLFSKAMEEHTEKLSEKPGPDVKTFGVDFVYDFKLKESPFADRFNVDNRWKQLARELSSANAPRSDFGRPTTRGTKIIKSRLTRIATDRKMMGVPTNKTGKGKPEVIVLIDMSGSMFMEHLIVKTMNAAAGMFEVFRQNRIPSSFYGHTTNVESTKCLVYGIAANDMPMKTNRNVTTHNAQDMFKRAVTQELLDNADGWVIEAVSKRFTDRPGDKILIVLSDGEPFASMGYTGTKAKKHVKDVVTKCRKDGIKVLSVSLTESVVKNNNKLFGKEFNVEAYGSNLERELQRISSMLV